MYKWNGLNGPVVISASNAKYKEIDMNSIKLKKLEDMKNKVGAMTSDEAIELAIHFDQMAKDVGPFDPAFNHFASNYTGFLAYAELLCENGE